MKFMTAAMKWNAGVMSFMAPGVQRSAAPLAGVVRARSLDRHQLPANRGYRLFDRQIALVGKTMLEDCGAVRVGID